MHGCGDKVLRKCGRINITARAQLSIAKRARQQLVNPALSRAWTLNDLIKSDCVIRIVKPSKFLKELGAKFVTHSLRHSG